MQTQIKRTSPGEWIVTTNKYGQIVVVQLNAHPSNIKTIAVFGGADSELSNEHIANAALLAISKDMLEALIAIQESLNPANEVVDLIAMNEMISNIFAKLANEAGEEL